MPQQASLTRYDGAATPVAHVFTDMGVARDPDGTIRASWRELLASVPTQAQMSRTQLLRVLKNGIAQAITRYELPVMEGVGAQNAAGYTAPAKVAYVDRIDVVSYAHPRSTALTRSILAQIVLNDLNNVATSVASQSAGPAMLLHIQLVQPT